VSEAAVKKHLTHLMSRYAVPNRAALVRASIAHGILVARPEGVDQENPVGFWPDAAR
jgi:hypothetical protein